jgi:hypothetical protein
VSIAKLGIQFGNIFIEYKHCFLSEFPQMLEAAATLETLRKHATDLQQQISMSISNTGAGVEFSILFKILIKNGKKIQATQNCIHNSEQSPVH